LAVSPYIYIYFLRHKINNDNLTQNARKPAWMLAFLWVKRSKKDDPSVTQMTQKMTQAVANATKNLYICKNILYTRVSLAGRANCKQTKGKTS